MHGSMGKRLWSVGWDFMVFEDTPVFLVPPPPHYCRRHGLAYLCQKCSVYRAWHFDPRLQDLLGDHGLMYTAQKQRAQ